MQSVTVLLWVFSLHRHTSRSCTDVRQHRYNSLDLAKEYIKGHNILIAYIHIKLYGSKRSSQRAGLIFPTCSSWSGDEAAFFAHIERLLNPLGEYRLTSPFDLI
jgi:hypothetical protein